jgi:phospholipase C
VIAAVNIAPSARAEKTASPIKHLVVIFQENVSFDHYFGTYPRADNPAGEPQFRAAPDTPSVNGLTGGLLTANPNNVNPFRLDRSQAATCDQNHDYMPEQQAFDAGLMDKFPQFLGVGSPGCLDYGFGKNLVMVYFDGNTVTALWNYAQHFAMSDNSFGTTFGPSTPGAINLVSGQTHGATQGAARQSAGDIKDAGRKVVDSLKRWH